MVDIPLSVVQDPADFAVAVQQHIDALHAFNTTKNVPRPTAHPLIESVIKRIQTPGKPDYYVSDYTVIDDTPPPPPEPVLSLEDKKAKHYMALVKAENEARDKVIPPRKMRLLSLSYQMAASKPEDQRTDVDIETINIFNILHTKWSEIGARAAKAEAEIEDLTEANIDDWKIPEL